LKFGGPIHFIEPNLTSKRLGVIDKRLGKPELKLLELQERLFELRKNSVKNTQKNLRKFTSHVRKIENMSLHIDKSPSEAIQYISDMSSEIGLNRIDISRSNTVRGLEPHLLQAGFEVLHTYDYATNSGNLGVFANLAPGYYWSLQGLELENSFQSFNINPEPLAYSRKLISKATSGQDFLGLVSANVFSATGEILIVQHLYNISSILTHAKQSFIVLTLDKLVENYPDALFQARCTAMYGLEQIILDLFDLERCKDKSEALADMNKGKTSREKSNKLRKGTQLPKRDAKTNYEQYVPPEGLHIIILDDLRKDLYGSKQEDLLYCIGCRRCAQLCPRVRGSGCQEQKAAAVSVSTTSSLTARELLMDGHLLGTQKAVDEGLFDCTLCRSCSNICPVDIELADHLLALRERCQKDDLFTAPHKRIRDNILNVGNAYGNEHATKKAIKAKSRGRN
jgi:L-lactate utilization protein LutB